MEKAGVCLAIYNDGDACDGDIFLLDRDKNRPIYELEELAALPRVSTTRPFTPCQTPKILGCNVLPVAWFGILW